MTGLYKLSGFEGLGLMIGVGTTIALASVSFSIFASMIFNDSTRTKTLISAATVLLSVFGGFYSKINTLYLGCMRFARKKKLIRERKNS